MIQCLLNGSQDESAPHVFNHYSVLDISRLNLYGFYSKLYGMLFEHCLRQFIGIFIVFESQDS
jgi:hypothetical protein